MQEMLDYVDKLNELDTDGIELRPIHFLWEMTREDVVTNGDDRDAMLDNAPKCKRRTVSSAEDGYSRRKG